MQSNGGSISPAQARRQPIRCILSGPAGGLIAAERLPTADGRPATDQSPVPRSFLTFDMGGTSTDVALIRGAPALTTHAHIGGLPIGIPVLDIHTIGAGGGSIAWLDPAGGLQVGPQSAGANPGPACYGRTGDRRPKTNEPRLPSPVSRLLPTVTDANLLLGRLLPDRFLGGAMPLFPQLALAAIQPLAAALALSPEETALGIIQIANAHMARALRLVSVQRGGDPADFALVSFGGAGGLHAAALARELGIPRLIIPRHASVFSALGMLLADVVKDYSQTVMLPGDTPLSNLQLPISSLIDRARADLLAEGIPPHAVTLEPTLDARLQGQSWELAIPFSENWQADFNRIYQETYGHPPHAAERQIVNVRLRARGGVESPAFEARPLAAPDPRAALLGTRPLWFGASPRATPIYDGGLLQPGHEIHGAALIVRSDTTILLEAGDHASVDPWLNFDIVIGKA
jgi:N-methylhydantoinase A